jgi:putative DNA primase/helicase
VAEQLSKAHPQAQLVICADDDQWTDGNPGRNKATEAAQSTGAVLVVPSFKDTDTKPTDFNDLARLEGVDTVKQQLTNAQHAEAIDSWCEPIPLPDGLAPVKNFSYKLLPQALAPWAEDICDRVQCPPDYVGVSAMVALGAALGRKLGIRPQAQTDWTEITNLWALIVGRPGVLKSPAMEAALSPLKRLAALANEAAAQAQADYQRDKALAELQQDAAKRQAKQKLAKDPRADVAHLLDVEEPEEPTPKRYIANDTTAAALGELMRQNPNGLLVHRDEIVSLLRSLDREDQAEARGFYLTAWNGNSGYTFDRITRGMNLHIPAVCLSLLGSTQPGRIAQYLRSAVQGGAGDDGLIQRFGMLVWPETSGAWKEVDRWPNTEAKRAAFDAFTQVDQLNPTAVAALQDTGPDGEPEGVPYLRFDEAGLGLFREWRTDLEAKLRGNELHPALESHLAKYRKLVPGLALLLHLADRGTGHVPYEAVLKALAWAEYLESHAHRAYGAVTTPEVDAAKAILYRLRRGDLAHEFSSRDVWRPGWAKLTDRQTVLDALQLLQDFDWLITRREETAGRPATVYAANPRGLQA